MKRIEMPCAAHFIGGADCNFRRATALVRPDGRAVVVSTVGNYRPRCRGPQEVGFRRWFETMVFHATPRPKPTCCAYEQASGVNIDFCSPEVPDNFNLSSETFWDQAARAQEQHEEMVRKWSEQDWPAEGEVRA